MVSAETIKKKKRGRQANWPPARSGNVNAKLFMSGLNKSGKPHHRAGAHTSLSSWPIQKIPESREAHQKRRAKRKLSCENACLNQVRGFFGNGGRHQRRKEGLVSCRAPIKVGCGGQPSNVDTRCCLGAPPQGVSNVTAVRFLCVTIRMGVRQVPQCRSLRPRPTSKHP